MLFDVGIDEAWHDAFASEKLAQLPGQLGCQLGGRTLPFQVHWHWIPHSSSRSGAIVLDGTGLGLYELPTLSFTFNDSLPKGQGSFLDCSTDQHYHSILKSGASVCSTVRHSAGLVQA